MDKYFILFGCCLWYRMAVMISGFLTTRVVAERVLRTQLMTTLGQMLGRSLPMRASDVFIPFILRLVLLFSLLYLGAALAVHLGLQL